MKKLYAILFVACALYTTNALAKEYVVKYENETGKILAWGSMSGVKADPGETVVSTDTKIENTDNYLVKDGVIVEKTDEEKLADKNAKKALKQARKARKKAMLSKIGLNQSDISALIEFIQDGSDE